MKKSLAMGVGLLAAWLSAGCSSDDGVVDPSLPRFADNGDGTITDTVAGLTWLKEAGCVDLPDTDANGRADWWVANGLDPLDETPVATGVRQLAHGTCGLTDDSSAGEWRLPTEDEWQALLDQAHVNGCSAPYFPDLLGTGCCGTNTCAFSGVQSVGYWSATADVDSPDGARIVSLNGGELLTGGKSASLLAWPVRDRR